MYERFAPSGFEVVYVGAFESEEACRAWKEEYELPFPVVPDDEDNTLFKNYSNGWVPWSVLIAPDGTVVFSENDFDESGFSSAIEQMYQAPTQMQASAPKPEIRPLDRSVSAKVVVLGGGTGGLVAAHHLRRRLPKKHEVTVIDRSPDYLFEPSLLWQLVGQRQPEQMRRPLERLRRKGIDFRREGIEEIDLQRQVVRTEAGEVDYDFLVISLGAQMVPDEVEGFADMAYNLYDPRDCARIHTALDEFEGGSIGILITAVPFKCPAAPYEAAFLIESLCRKKGIRKDTEIHIFTPEHIPLPVAPEKMGNRLVGLLEKRGIHYHPLFTFKELRPESSTVVASDGSEHRVDLLLAVPPHRAPDVIRSSPLLGASGFIHVDPTTMQTPYERVYAIGDVTTIKLPNGKALPKAGVFAHAQGDIVAKRIAAELRGRPPSSEFKGNGYCWIELGDGKAVLAGGNFYAEREPRLRMVPPSRLWHWTKVGFEKWWLRHWF